MYIVTARWFIKKARARVLRGLKGLAREVRSSEPDTWVYLVHTSGDGSLPPTSQDEVIFFEAYKDKKAFLAHVQGKAFTGFTKRYGNCFVPDFKGGPFVLVERLDQLAGFDRKKVRGA